MGCDLYSTPCCWRLMVWDFPLCTRALWQSDFLPLLSPTQQEHVARRRDRGLRFMLMVCKEPPRLENTISMGLAVSLRWLLVSYSLYCTDPYATLVSPPAMMGQLHPPTT